MLFARQFVSMVNQTVFATSVSEDKPILTGILLECENNLMRMVALDGYRLAIRQENLSGNLAVQDVVVPAKSMREVAHIIPDDDTVVNLYASDKMIGVLCENVEIVTRVLQGDYVKYKSILPNEHATRLIVPRQSLLNSLERASILARQSKTNLVNLKIDKDILTITSDSEVGKVREEVGIRITGKNLDIAFNARYLLDVLKEVDDEEIVMDFNTSISPCVIHPIKGDSYLYLVLPVKTNTVN
jgi:DNA polymerase-3 subunit beta